MLTGRTWEDVRAAIGDAWHPRRGLTNTAQALERLGFEWGPMRNGVPLGSYLCITDARAMVSAPLLWGRRALLSVPSTNHEGRWHLVYWDGRELFDPSPCPPERGLFDLVPREVHIFMEVETLTDVRQIG